MRKRSLWFGLSLLAAVAIAGAVHVWATGVLSTQLVLKVNATGTSTTLGLGTADDPIVKDYTQLLSSGTGANQASDMFHDQRTLTASSTENLDLSGTLTNAFGVTLNFTKIKAIIIHAASTNTNNVLVGGAATNTFINWVADPTDIVVVRPGGTFILVAPDVTGYGVTASTGDILKVANSSSGTSVVYDVIILGVS